jgi:hypothetical protein
MHPPHTHVLSAALGRDDGDDEAAAADDETATEADDAAAAAGDEVWAPPSDDSAAGFTEDATAEEGRVDARDERAGTPPAGPGTRERNGGA